MIEQGPSVRDYSTKDKLTQLIEVDLTQSGNSTLNTQSLTQEPQREGESSGKGIFKYDASVPCCVTQNLFKRIIGISI